MTQDGRRWKRDFTFDHVQIGMTDTAGMNTDERFARFRFRDWNLFRVKRPLGLAQHSGRHQ